MKQSMISRWTQPLSNSNIRRVTLFSSHLCTTVLPWAPVSKIHTSTCGCSVADITSFPHTQYPLTTLCAVTLTLTLTLTNTHIEISASTSHSLTLPPFRQRVWDTPTHYAVTTTKIYNKLLLHWISSWNVTIKSGLITFFILPIIIKYKRFFAATFCFFF